MKLPKNNLVNKTILKRYHIKEHWKEGGQSSLFTAVDLETNEIVLVKVITLNSKNDKKYFDELKISKCIDVKNENIIKIYDYCIHDDYFFLILEKFDAPNLRAYMNHNDISLDDAIEIILKIIHGLKALHFSTGYKIIHRDIKPENILIDKNKNLKIIDFGISSLYHQQKVLTDEKEINLSINYACPDIRRLKKEIRSLDNKEKHANFQKIVSYQFDIHALGVIFFELITKTLPFPSLKTSLKPTEKIKLWEKFDVPKISTYMNNIPIQIDIIIHRMLASKKEYLKHRYKDINQIEHDLLNYKNIKPEPIWNKLKFEDEQPIFHIVDYNRKKRNIILSATLMFLIALLAIVIFFFVRRFI